MPASPLDVRVQAFPIGLIRQCLSVTEKGEVVLLLCGREPPVCGDVQALPLRTNKTLESDVDDFRG